MLQWYNFYCYFIQVWFSITVSTPHTFQPWILKKRYIWNFLTSERTKQDIKSVTFSEVPGTLLNKNSFNVHFQRYSPQLSNNFFAEHIFVGYLFFLTSHNGWSSKWHFSIFKEARWSESYRNQFIDFQSNWTGFYI